MKMKMINKLVEITRISLNAAIICCLMHIPNTHIVPMSNNIHAFMRELFFFSDCIMAIIFENQNLYDFDWK